VATIPASDIVQVNPGVLPAGGSALDMIGLMLTTNTRAPAGQVLAFASPANISTYFGPASFEFQMAEIYFLGFDNSHKKPGSLLIAQYNPAAVDAYLRGAAVTGLTIPQLQAINGTLTITVDGYVRSASALNLSAASSFSAAATLIQTALNAGAANPNVATFTASLAASTNSFTGSIQGNQLTVTAITSGTIVAGTTITGGAIAASTIITGQISGTPGGIGVYSINNSQNVASLAISGTYGTLTVTAVGSGTLSVNQTIAGGTIAAGTQITQLGTGAGLTGTYFVSTNTTSGSGACTAAGSPVTVTFDSISGAFIITSTVIAAAPLTSTMGFASGTTADPLNLRQQDGAVLSPGAAAATPVAFMTSLVAVTQDWATLMTLFDPDNSNSGANAQKMQFATWVNSTNDEYMYVAWDNDVTPTLNLPASSSMGDLLQNGNFSGTYPQWAPDTIQGPTKAAFVCGMVASIDFTQLNGRITLAFKSQTGLFADVTNQTIAHNLGGVPQSIGNFGNGYNFYGAYATANQQFVWENRGTVSGPFLWADSYVNQIWLNNALQLALMELLGNVFSIPYNTTGYALIESACLDPINAAINFGAIRAGITLSQAQIQEVNTAAGVDVATTIQQRGWYLQISDASAQVRAARASPPCTLWYTDGQSVQAITLASIEVQ
jgi:hypothetical protein